MKFLYFLCVTLSFSDSRDSRAAMYNIFWIFYQESQTKYRGKGCVLASVILAIQVREAFPENVDPIVKGALCTAYSAGLTWGGKISPIFR